MKDVRAEQTRSGGQRGLPRRAPSSTRPAVRQGVAAPLAVALAALAGGCANPLAPRESDYGVRIPPERLREVRTLEMSGYVAPVAPEKAEEPIDLVRQRFEGRTSVVLTIEESRAAALEHNLDLRVALVDPAIAARRVSEEEAAFELLFDTRALWQETDSPTASQLTDAQAEFGSIEPGITVPLRTGGQARISLPITRSETNNPFSTLNPSYTSDLQFSIVHPLLRNAGRRANTAAIRITEYERQISEAQTKLQIIAELARVERTYWRLYQALQALGVREQQYRLAQAQLERAQRQHRAGRAPEVDVIRAEAGIAERLEAIIVAQNEVLLQQRELKRVLNIPGLDIGGRTLIEPGTPPDPVEYRLDAGALTEAALANRMELLEVELRLLADATTIDLRRNQTLPLLDLDAGYRINGLGATGRESFRTLRDNNFEDWNVGARFELPLGNEAAESRLAQAVLTRLQRLSTKEARRLQVRQDVLNAVDLIEAGWQRILAARQATVLAARTLAAEERQFDVGARTSTDVLDAATRLAEAQLTEIQAVTDYQIAQVDLAVATGTLLGAVKVSWEPFGGESAGAGGSTDAVDP